MKKTPPLFLPQLPLLPMDRGTFFSSPTSWGIKNPERFAELMKEAQTLVAPGYYLGDNLFVWGRNLSMLEDPTFKDAWESNIQTGADQAIAWRRYILASCAHHCIQLEGDFVECGVFNGTGIKTVMDYLGGPDFPRTFWGYDTFDYHPVTGRGLGDQAEDFFETVCQRFATYPQVRLIKGLLPASFDQGLPTSVAYLHVDLNSAEGEIATLERLFDKVVPGGMVILDDYEWSGPYRAQKRVEDQWFQQRDYRVVPLPTGQGLVIKR